MAMPDTSLRINERGTWPGPLSFRRGWARATARPWNDAQPDASLRLVRGSGSFLAACSERLLECGAPSVLSPPLPQGARKTWEEIGYRAFLDLALMRLPIADATAAPDHLVVEADPVPLAELLEIDAAAFSPFWRFDEAGLREAMDATGRSSVLIIRDAEGGPAGFAIVGFGTTISYLQRVAVHPRWQAQGMGRSLVRVSARKARAAGARVMLLNTQVDNTAAIGLYRAEGYATLPEPLALLRFQG